MTMTLKKKIAGTAFALAFALAPSASMADGITREQYPDADAVVVDGEEFCIYRPDGTYVTTNFIEVAVLTEKGRREESSYEMNYNARYGTAEILEVAIVGADGAKRIVDVSATTKESTDNSSAAENIYDPMHRKIVCTVPGVKVGDTVRFTTRREVSKARVENQFADIYTLEWTYPIVRQTVRVLAPKDLPLVHTLVRNPLGNVEYGAEPRGDGSVLHTWTVRDAPQAFPEPDTPPLYTLMQNIRVSTASDWPTLSRWYWNLSVPHLERTSSAITNQVSAILASAPKGDGHDERLARIKAVYKWVSQEIRYMGLTMEDTSPGYAPHDVDLTFENRYGVCRDKAALLVEMLRIAGFEAFPVLIHAGAKMDPDVPQPYFNHAICSVRAKGSPYANKDGFILMDPTDESSRDLLPAYLSDRSYLVATPEGEGLHVSQVPTAEENAVRVKSEGTLEKDGSILLSSEISIGGVNDNAYRRTLLRCRVDERRRMFERIARAAASGAELLSFELSPEDLQDTSKPLGAKLLVRIPETVLRGETRDELTPPLLSSCLGLANWILEGNTSLDTRRFPLKVNSTALVDETLKVKLGGNVGAPLALPEEERIDGPYEFRRTFEVADGVLAVRRRLAVNSVEFSPEEYSNLRESIKRVEAAERRRPVFGKDRDAGADVHVKLARRDYVLKGDREWVVTNTVVKEVLTYDGKKNSSELSFRWNPKWQNVELLFAAVSNKNGKVSRVSEKERNVFDCGWAAAAPRYPASKELVVNLPSVEVGSVIAYRTVTTVSNSPAAFCTVLYKDVFEPTDKLVYTVSGPDGALEAVSVVNPKRLKVEAMQPDGRLWRDSATVSRGDFRARAARLARAAEIADVDWREALGRDAAKPEGADGVLALRNWMAKNVRIAGPALDELPLEYQLTDPRRVLKERYATRLDYIRTLAALLDDAGYDVDVVFASGDADRPDAVKKADMYTHPNEYAFSSALCRVKVKEGGFLGFGGEWKTYFVGTENEYAPLGSTIYHRSHFLDTADASFGVVTVPEADLAPRSRKEILVSVRENGAADIDVVETSWGPSVGAFRKQYAEMLPEDRSRHYQELLGEIAQAASATQDLITDVDSYPAVKRFSCYVPDYATVADGAITLALPELGSHIFPLTGNVRETPIGVGSRSPAELEIAVRFPEGYLDVECEPSAFTVRAPGSAYDTWYEYTGAVGGHPRSGDADRLGFIMSRRVCSRGESMLGPEWFDHLKALDARATSRANRTITVRKAK